MSKAVLISIQPKWCELIANGKKTVEVRKTKPKLSTPFKVYIYQTKRTWIYNIYSRIADWQSKVIGEFVCDRIDEMRVVDSDLMRYVIVNDKIDMYITEEARLSVDELYDYLWPKKGYAWHISDLVIYDKPKELGVFQKYGALSYDDWLYGIYNGTSESDYENYLKPFKVVHAPQSWCYVEEWIP